MIREDLKARVIKWAEDRNFFGPGGATVEGQLAKLLEEASELVTSIVRGRDATDDIGDCLVVLTILERMGGFVTWPDYYKGLRSPIIYAGLFASEVSRFLSDRPSLLLHSADLLVCATRLKIDPNAALEHALREIEPRKGSWSGGVFVKEAA